MAEGPEEAPPDPLAATRAWLEHAVIGLRLCPFANAPLVGGRVRFALCDSDDPRDLVLALVEEMRTLAAADPAAIETTLLVHPRALLDFDDFNDFLDTADAALAELGLDGTLQVASFHPAYRFDGTEPDELQNATNRSPYPTLQLLREASIDRAVASGPSADAIVDANLETLDELGADGWDTLRRRWSA